MTINLTRMSNGIHDYIKFDVEDILTQQDLDVLVRLSKVVLDYNQECVDKA